MRTPEEQERFLSVDGFQVRQTHAKPRRTEYLWSIAFGALVEIATLFALIPKDSTEPPTRLQYLLGYSQMIWFSLARVFKTLGGLPVLVNIAVLAIVSAAGFVLQSAMMGCRYGSRFDGSDHGGQTSESKAARVIGAEVAIPSTGGCGSLTLIA